MKRLKLGFSYSDANRFDYEKKDCVVRALSIATGTGYKRTHKYVSERGRKDKSAMKVSLVAKAYENSTLGGYTIRPIYRRRKTNEHSLRWFANNFEWPKRCLVEVVGHVFAVVDGKIRDLAISNLRSKVYTIWEVRKVQKVDKSKVS